MFKTIKWNTGSAAARFRSTMKKKKKKNKAASSQAGGPAPKESGLKRPSLTGLKRIVYDVDTLQVLGYYRKEKC